MKKLYLISFLSALFITQPAAGEMSEQNQIKYAQSVRVPIMQKFYEADDYKGRQCDIGMEVNSSGKIISIKESNDYGDKELCDIAKKVILRATLPKFDSGDGSIKMKFVLSFRP